MYQVVNQELYQKIELEIINDSVEYTKVQQFIQEINTVIMQYCLDLDVNLIYESEVLIIDYLKAMKLKIDTSVSSIYDKIINIIDVEAELMIFKCLVFVDVLKYFNIDLIHDLLKYIQYKKVPILFMEKNMLEIGYNNRYTIDIDFIEQKL